MNWSGAGSSSVARGALTTFPPSLFKGLVFLKESLGDRFLGGIVLGTAGEGYQYAERLWGLPVAALW